MIIDKFRNRYSFNILVVSGWIVFAIVMYSFISILIFSFSQSIDGLGLPLVLICIFIAQLQILLGIISFIVYIVELLLNNIEITNKNFLNSKIIHWLQNSGIIFLISYALFFIVAFILISLL